MAVVFDPAAGVEGFETLLQWRGGCLWAERMSDPMKSKSEKRQEEEEKRSIMPHEWLSQALDNNIGSNKFQFGLMARNRSATQPELILRLEQAQSQEEATFMFEVTRKQVENPKMYPPKIKIEQISTDDSFKIVAKSVEGFVPFKFSKEDFFSTLTTRRDWVVANSRSYVHTSYIIELIGACVIATIRRYHRRADETVKKMIPWKGHVCGSVNLRSVSIPIGSRHKEEWIEAVRALLATVSLETLTVVHFIYRGSAHSSHGEETGTPSEIATRMSEPIEKCLERPAGFVGYSIHLTVKVVMQDYTWKR